MRFLVFLGKTAGDNIVMFLKHFNEERSYPFDRDEFLFIDVGTSGEELSVSCKKEEKKSFWKRFFLDK